MFRFVPVAHFPLPNLFGNKLLLPASGRLSSTILGLIHNSKRIFVLQKKVIRITGWCQNLVLTQLSFVFAFLGEGGSSSNSNVTSA
jgi:hypothetical protein